MFVKRIFKSFISSKTTLNFLQNKALIRKFQKSVKDYVRSLKIIIYLKQNCALSISKKNVKKNLKFKYHTISYEKGVLSLRRNRGFLRNSTELLKKLPIFLGTKIKRKN